jgi:hypothetical protein
MHFWTDVQVRNLVDRYCSKEMVSISGFQDIVDYLLKILYKEVENGDESEILQNQNCELMDLRDSTESVD